MIKRRSWPDHSERNGLDGKEPERSVRGYIGSVKKSLMCSDVQKKRVVAEIEDDVYAYVEENGVNSIDEIVRYFGAPETVAESFIDPGQNGEIRRRTSLKRAFIAFVCIIAMLLGAFLTTTYVDSHRSNYGYVDNEVHERAAIEIPVFVIQ